MRLRVTLSSFGFLFASWNSICGSVQFIAGVTWPELSGWWMRVAEQAEQGRRTNSIMPRMIGTRSRSTTVPGGEHLCTALCQVPPPEEEEEEKIGRRDEIEKSGMMENPCYRWHATMVGVGRSANRSNCHLSSWPPQCVVHHWSLFDQQRTRKQQQVTCNS